MTAGTKLICRPIMPLKHGFLAKVPQQETIDGRRFVACASFWIIIRD
jgi:hypothetical protein